MKFLHTADLHIGKAFKGMGDKGDDLRAAQLETLEKIAGVATSENVDFVVIAGDLFDSNEVTKKAVKKVVEVLGDIAPIPVFILPGTHDVLNAGSVYRGVEFAGEGNIKVFGIDGLVTARVGEAAVHGRANDTKGGGVHPLEELEADAGAKYNIGVLHASMEIEGKASPDDYLVDLGRMGACGMDYIALGHWHRFAEFKAGAVKAFYCGCPEITKFDEADAAGDVLVVTLDEAGATPTVKRVPVGKYKWIDKEIDVTTCPAGGPLESEIKDCAGEDVIMQVTLSGTINPGEEISAGDLEDEFGEEFFQLTVDDSKVGYQVEAVEGMFSENTIGALFVGRMKQAIDNAADDEQRALLEKALARGSHYIADGEV